MIIAFAKSIIRIFRMGVQYKADLVTRQEQQRFEEEVRRDMRGYASQIQKSVMESIMNVISARMKDIEAANKAAVDMQIMKAEMDAELKKMDEKYEEMKQMTDTIRTLNNKVQRLEYGAQQQQSTVRRTEK